MSGIMAWLDSLSWLEVGCLWLGLVCAYGLATLLMTSKAPYYEPPPPRLYYGRLDFSTMDEAIERLQENMDSLRTFADAPPGIGHEEIQRIGGGLERANKVVPLRRRRGLGSWPPPANGKGRV